VKFLSRKSRILKVEKRDNTEFIFDYMSEKKNQIYFSRQQHETRFDLIANTLLAKQEKKHQPQSYGVCGLGKQYSIHP
jgi:hypothetical protein